QKIPLRHRQLVRRLADVKIARGPPGVGFGGDLDPLRRATVGRGLLADLPARVLDRDQAPLHLELALQATGESRVGDEGERRAVQRAPVRAEHRPVVDWLRWRDRGGWG